MNTPDTGAWTLAPGFMQDPNVIMQREALFAFVAVLALLVGMVLWDLLTGRVRVRKPWPWGAW